MEFIDKRPEEKRYTRPTEAMKITEEMLAAAGGATTAMVEQIIRKRDDACFEELAAVYCKYFPDAECSGSILRTRLNQLLAAEQRLQESDCPTCGQYPTCYHNQGAHGVVRINCPLWRPKG